MKESPSSSWGPWLSKRPGLAMDVNVGNAVPATPIPSAGCVRPMGTMGTPSSLRWLISGAQEFFTWRIFGKIENPRYQWYLGMVLQWIWMVHWGNYMLMVNVWSWCINGIFMIAIFWNWSVDIVVSLFSRDFPISKFGSLLLMFSRYPNEMSKSFRSHSSNRMISGEGIQPLGV